MFFFIGGIQPKTVSLDRNPRICPACGRLKLYLKRRDQYLSVFFIPLFPIRKGTSFLMCDHCRSVFNEQGSRMDRPLETGTKKKCPYCRKEVSSDFSFCPYCGNKIL